MVVENTTGNMLPELQKQNFQINDIPTKKMYESGQTYYQFQLKTIIDEEVVLHTEKLAIWMCGPMFKALGCSEVKPGHFDVAPTEMLGKQIKASIKHEKITKGKSAGKVVARLYDIEPGEEIEF